MSQLQKLQRRTNEINVEINEQKNIEDPAPVDVRTLEDEVVNFDKKITELESKKTELSRRADKVGSVCLAYRHEGLSSISTSGQGSCCCPVDL